ncbi:MAG: tetratricopeptide repeat protein [Acidobacteria bacterium]|nr:tetratricopeptide repeat protein [Acidobacteriota bacterium]
MESRLRQQLQTANEANAELSTRINRLEDEVEALRSALEVANRRMDTLSQQLAGVRTTPPAVLPPVTAEPGAEGTAPPAAGGQPTAEEPAQPPAAGTKTQAAALPDNPDQLYRSAYQDYMRGNYQLAIQGFQEYIKRYPKTDLTDNAQYWIGECYDALGQEDDALKAFSTVLDSYPTSDKGAAAQLNSFI